MGWTQRVRRRNHIPDQDKRKHHREGFKLTWLPNLIGINLFRGLPRWLSGKESTCQSRRHAINPWVVQIPWRRKWQPTPVSLPGDHMDRRSLTNYSPWALKRVRHNWGTKHNLFRTVFLRAYSTEHWFHHMLYKKTMRGEFNVQTWVRNALHPLERPPYTLGYKRCHVCLPSNVFILCVCPIM